MTYVSDVIKYEQDIEPYRVVQIYAGVGAGKNAWVAHLVESGKRVLLVTSRKATADAQANKLEGCRWINLDEIQKPEGNNAVVVTNAGIEKYIKYKYNKDDERTHLWKYFDVVVIDEAHSLAADATLSDAPFYTMTFVTQVYRESQCKIVLMTGTPDQLDKMLSESFKESPKFNFKDIYASCVHVFPKEVYFMGNKGLACQYLCRALQNGTRVVYFANTISSISGIIRDLQSYGLDEKYIGVAFSGSSKRANFSKRILDDMPRIQESLATKEKIPSDIRLFITTSKSKEGINILDDNIEFMAAESTDKCSLIQMAGRIRHGIKRLIVLYNAAQNEVDDLVNFEEELHKACLPFVNEITSRVREHERNRIIERIEEHFPYIRYNYFEGKFGKYLGKICAVRQILNDHEQLGKNIFCYDNYKSSPTELKQWFPDSEIVIKRTWSSEEQAANFKAELLDYMNKNQYLNVTFSKEKRESLFLAIKGMASKYESKAIGVSAQAKALNPILKKYGYEIIAKNKHWDQFFIREYIQQKRRKAK